MAEQWFDMLAAARQRVGLSQAELAARSHVSAESIKAYERGKRHPSRPYLTAILDALRRLNPTVPLDLLHQAMAGHAIPAVLEVADHLAGHGDELAMRQAVARLVAVGHSSGTALAWGLLRGATEAVTKMGAAMGATDD